MKKILGFITALMLFAVINVPAFAAETQYLYDNANLLSQSEEQTVESALEKVSKDHSMDTVIVTVNGLGGKSPESYADDFYDASFGRDGMIFLVDMDSRQWQIVTDGKCVDAVNDDGIKYLEEKTVSLLSDGEFASAFLEFADETAYLMECYESGESYVYEEPIPWGTNAIIAIVAGILFGFAIAGYRKSRLKSVHRKAAATEYADKGSFALTGSREFFLFHTISRTEKPTVNDGNSGTHMSSAGHVHGGGGGRF